MVTSVRFALKVVMQNDGDFEDVILLYVRLVVSSCQTIEPSGLQVIHNEINENNSIQEEVKNSLKSGNAC
jgi:hypothetical protein